MHDPLESSPPPWQQRLTAWRAALPVPVPAAALVTLGVLVVAGVVLAVTLSRPDAPLPELTLPRAAPPAPAPPDAIGATSTTAGGMVTVHAAGAVVRPGVYAIPASARVADLLTAAGGPADDADLDRVNLAARLGDAERVYVPRRGEPAPPPGAATGGTDEAAKSGGAPSPAQPLDLNAATQEQLEALPGVGPATARAILAYRERRGRFRSAAELIEVPGVGPAKLETLKPLVRV